MIDFEMLILNFKFTILRSNRVYIPVGYSPNLFLLGLGPSGFSVLGGDPLDPEASPKNPPPDEFSPPPSVPPQSNFVQGVKIPPIAGRPGGGGGGQPQNC